MQWAMVAAAVACSAGGATATPVKRLPRTFTPIGYRARIALEERHGNNRNTPSFYP